MGKTLKYLLLILFAIVYTFPLYALQDTFFVECLDGKERALGVHLPENINKSRKCPVVLWLHGGVNGTRQNRGAEVAHYFAKESDSLGFIFASPSGERSATWFDNIGIDNIKKSLQIIKKNYRIDTSRIVIAGVSDGGTGAYMAAILYSEYFTRFAVLSGSFELPAILGYPLTASAMKGKKWLIAHGGKDHLYSGNDLQKWVSNMKGQSVDIEFRYFPEAPHGLDYMPSLRDSLLNFFVR